MTFVAMKNATEIWELGERRLAEAKALLQNDFCEGALYLAGYSIELFLKAKICELLRIPNLFDEAFSSNDIKARDFRKPFYTHDLAILLYYSGLSEKFLDEKAQNQAFAKNWELLSETWNENCRYKICGSFSTRDTQRSIAAIEDASNGVKQWIKNA